MDVDGRALAVGVLALIAGAKGLMGSRGRTRPGGGGTPMELWEVDPGEFKPGDDIEVWRKGLVWYGKIIGFRNSSYRDRYLVKQVKESGLDYPEAIADEPQWMNEDQLSPRSVRG